MQQQRAIISSLLGGLLFALLSGLAMSDEVRTETLQFAKGATGTTVSDNITGYNAIHYKVTARAGQRMVVQLSSRHLATYFNVFAPGTGPGDAAIFIGSTKGDRFVTTLKESGTYTIQVYMMRSAARRNESADFKLHVEIDNSESSRSQPHQRGEQTVGEHDASGNLPCPAGESPCPLEIKGGTSTVAAMPTRASDCVILLHGLAKSDSSMKKLEQAVDKAGFFAVNVNYPSTEFPIEQLAGRAIAPALDHCARNSSATGDATSSVHFVTHSMGGILVRQYLSNVKVENLGRVVMLGPPNQGSEVVDKLGSFPGFHFIYGDAGLQLGSGKMSVPNTLGAASFDLGIIAGTRSINPILSRMLPGTDDGKVTVERTRLEGMRDHLEMPVNHVFMMKDQKVIAQVIHYLQHGRFQREAAQPGGD